MKKFGFIWSLVVGLCLCQFGNATSPVPNWKTLTPGAYSAKVNALACEGCGAMVQKTLGKIRGLSAISVDSQMGNVEFSVENTISLEQIQQALDAAAKDMGLGADYHLSEIHRAMKRN